MFSKDEIEQLAKDCAFEYNVQWWADRRRTKKDKAKNGDIVAFQKSHRVFNGVVALWGRGSSAVLFYTTPHDVEDEKRYGWIPPIFRVEIRKDYIYSVPREKKSVDEEVDYIPLLPELPNLTDAEQRVLNRWFIPPADFGRR